MSLTLPNFFVIGAFRCGTTSLASYLGAHPEVFIPAEKEPNYFAIDGNDDASDELRARSITTRFAYEHLYDSVNAELAIGDISPEYLRTPSACEVIHDNVPDGRLIAVLRDPSDRAYSDYLMHVRDGKERAPDFAHALDDDEQRLARGPGASRYLEPGFYATQLRRYFDRFPSSRIEVLLFEDLVADTRAVMGQVFRFVGVDDTVVLHDVPSLNSGGIPKNAVVGSALRMRRHLRRYVSRQALDRMRPLYERAIRRQLTRPPIEAEDRARLVSFYRDEILSLETMLDRELSAWREAPAC